MYRVQWLPVVPAQPHIAVSHSDLYSQPPATVLRDIADIWCLAILEIAA